MKVCGNYMSKQYQNNTAGIVCAFIGGFENFLHFHDDFKSYTHTLECTHGAAADDTDNEVANS